MPIISDHDTILENISLSLNVAETILVDLEEVGGHRKEMDQLKEEFKRMLDEEYKVKVQKKVVDQMKQRLVQGYGLGEIGTTSMEEDEEGSMPQRDYENDDFVMHVSTVVAKKMKVYLQKSEKERYNGNPAYVDLCKKIWEVNHTGAFKMDEDEEEDDELAVIGEQESLICPIMRTLMEEPHTSIICHHSFSKAIIDLIKSNNGKLECPVAGCRKILRLSDLKFNKALNRKIERHRESQEDMEAEFGEEGDEVSD
ncbi:hypothetical protein BC829DRAFT_438676 [Chytridium lagenaria]|nr:hypothetical protein BC829DRAFT_438676 [Chytridium lagenaria]